MAISRKARREIFWILLLAACFSLTYILIFAEGGYLEFRKARDKLQQLLRENQDLRQQQQIYREKIRKLRVDPNRSRTHRPGSAWLRQAGRHHRQLARPDRFASRPRSRKSMNCSGFRVNPGNVATTSSPGDSTT